METADEKAQGKGAQRAQIEDLEEIAVAALLSTRPRPDRAELPQISQAWPAESPSCILLDRDLWKQFDLVGNEMIITRSGRCLFPTLKISFQNLHPAEKYRAGLEFELLSGCKLKFAAERRASWDCSPLPSAKMKRKIEKFPWIKPSGQIYFPGDSEQSGAFWMENGANFSSVKLTNRALQPAEAQKGLFSLASFHLYQPRIHLASASQSWSFAFGATKFVAVTHYQNPRVNFLKKIHNPHAKGFKLALEAADAIEF
jgi:hypothetical protein